MLMAKARLAQLSPAEGHSHTWSVEEGQMKVHCCFHFLPSKHLITKQQHALYYNPVREITERGCT